MRGKLSIFLDRDDIAAQAREQCSGIARRGADQQHALARLGRSGDQQSRCRERRIEGAVGAQRHGAVDIGCAATRQRQVILARFGENGFDDLGIVDIAGSQLAFHHRAAHRPEILLGHEVPNDITVLLWQYSNWLCLLL